MNQYFNYIVIGNIYKEVWAMYNYKEHNNESYK